MRRILSYSADVRCPNSLAPRAKPRVVVLVMVALVRHSASARQSVCSTAQSLIARLGIFASRTLGAVCWEQPVPGGQRLGQSVVFACGCHWSGPVASHGEK